MGFTVTMIISHDLSYIEYFMKSNEK